MDKYVKTVKFDFDYDKQSLDSINAEIDKEIANLQNILTGDIGTDYADAIVSAISDLDAQKLDLNTTFTNATANGSTFDETSDMSEFIDGLDIINEILTEINEVIQEENDKEQAEIDFEDFKSKATDLVKNTLTNAFNSFVSNVKDAFSDAWEELDNILAYSKLSDSNTRELAFTYGFNSSEAYGYDKSMDILGLESFEDLMYMTAQEQEQFNELFKNYSSRYADLYDSGFFTDLQDYNVEMANFQEEMQLELVQFFMDNKDTIQTTMKAMIDLSSYAIKVLGWFVDNWGGGTAISDSAKSAATSDIVNQYSSSNSSTTNTNVNVDNTFNNVASSDQSWLANAGQLTYEQVIKALE